METTKEVNSIVAHCDHLFECGWEWSEVQSIVGNACWRIYVSDTFGEEYMKILLGEEE